MEKVIQFLDEKKEAIIKGIVVFILFFYVSYVQYIPVILFHLDPTNMSDAMKVLLSSFSSIILAFVLFFIYRKELKKDFKKFWKNKMEYMDTGVKYWIAGLAIMMGTNLLISLVLKGGGAQNEKLVQTMIHAIPWLMVINAGIIAPFNEEIVFRKTLHDVFGKYKWLFVILAFLLFGYAHVMNVAKAWTDYLYMIPYGALGGAFALAYYKTDNFFTSTILHMVHNVILILLSIFAL